MKSSSIITVATLTTLGQAAWPSPLRASNLTTHGISSHPSLETISLPNVPSAPSSSSSRQTVEDHSLSSFPTGHSLSTQSSGAAISASSLSTTTHGSSTRRRVVYHTLPPSPTYHLSSQPSVVTHSHSSLSPAHNSSSSPPATVIPSSQPSAATPSVVEVSPSARPCVCLGGHDDPSCCYEETQTITRLVLIAAPTTVVDHDGKTRTVTRDRISTVTTIQANASTATVIDYKTHTMYMRPSPTTWDPLHSSIRPYPSIFLHTNKNSGRPTPWDPPRKPHGTVRPYPSEQKENHHKSHGTVRQHPPEERKKHHKPTYTISVFGPETTCPAGFTCQPDDNYTGKKLAVREANVPWPAPPGCANHCVGGRGCWTECDKPHLKPPSRICPEGYSCQRKKKPVPAPVPESTQQRQPHEQLPTPKQQPAPPAAYPEPPRIPAPMPPPPPFVSPRPVQPPPPVVQPPLVSPPAVLSPLVSPPAFSMPPASPPAALSPPFVLSPVVEQSPTAAPNPVIQSSITPVQLSTAVGTGPEVPPAPSHHCPSGEHPCAHRHTNGTVGAPETVTKAGAELFTPASIMAMIFAGGFGLIMI